MDWMSVLQLIWDVALTLSVIYLGLLTQHLQTGTLDCHKPAPCAKASCLELDDDMGAHEGVEPSPLRELPGVKTEESFTFKPM